MASQVINVIENDFYLHSANIEILSSKTKHGVQDKDMASQCTTPMSSVSHKYVTTCKYIYINMFCLADIKNKDNFGKTVGPTAAKDLWIPNP
jgi:hypothetical protein